MIELTAEELHAVAGGENDGQSTSDRVFRLVRRDARL
jgi:hypothetical protein